MGSGSIEIGKFLRFIIYLFYLFLAASGLS